MYVTYKYNSFVKTFLYHSDLSNFNTVDKLLRLVTTSVMSWFASAKKSSVTP